MVRNLAVEAEDKLGTIEAAAKIASGSHHPRTFVGIIGVNPQYRWLDLAVAFNLWKTTIW